MALSANNLLLSDIQTLSNSDDPFMEKCKRGAKRKRSEPEEVIQVRAKRGQATDSHSVAERARRNKINDRLKCLQTLVPGCYEPMGMAVMLDAVIGYVHSLQNQIEFLSMKLSAASMYCDYSSPSSNDFETKQGTNFANQSAQEIAERAVREGFGGFVNNYY